MPTITAEPELDLLAHQLANSLPSQNPRRNGKIARLPKKTRDMLNQMLDDGLPYHVIIEELGEPGKCLNLQNITNWLHGGYQDHLRHQEALENAKAQIEFAIEFLRENGGFDLAQVRRACNYVAALQLFQAVRDHGDDALKHIFQATPAKYLSTLHVLCHQSNSALKLEKHRLKQKLCGAISELQSSPIKANQAPAPISPNLAILPSEISNLKTAPPSGALQAYQAARSALLAMVQHHPLDAAVRNQPDEGHAHVNGAREPGSEECQRNGNRVKNGGKLPFEVAPQ